MKGKLLKKLTAGALSLLIVSGGIPVSSIADMVADLTLTASAEGGTISGSGTQSNPYIIEDFLDWAVFADGVNEGGSYRSAYVKLSDSFDNSDSPVTNAVGSEEFPFTGTFDGNGRTLTVNISDDQNQGTAPFRFIADGASIKNLTVTGSVSGTTHASGLVGFSKTNSGFENTYNTIENCVVNTNVTVTTTSGNRHMGGVVGHGLVSYLKIKDTVFGGTMSNSGNYAGGLQGWSDGSHLTIENCLFKGSYTGTASNGFHPMSAVPCCYQFFKRRRTFTDVFFYPVICVTEPFLMPNAPSLMT